MCGVIGFISEAHRDDLGVVAAELLKTLEYRGYDSTGAAVQGDTDAIVLRKGVGAPSAMVEELGIIGLGGSILCGRALLLTWERSTICSNNLMMPLARCAGGCNWTRTAYAPQGTSARTRRYRLWPRVAGAWQSGHSGLGSSRRSANGQDPASLNVSAWLC